MKSFCLFIGLLVLSQIGFSQSKKDLRQQLTTLTSEKQKLLNDVLDLKQQILDLKTQNFDLKSENEKLKTELITKSVNTNNNVNPEPNNQDKNSTTTSSGRCQAITAKGTQCTRNADPGSKYCWQHKKTYDPESTTTSSSKNSSVSTSGSSGSSTYGGKTIYTGPRGGKYYINSHGNKTYIKH